mmetsp:Transcript_43428/g.41880  ORF Transcript_43428/g.41880 Transcript_43428/m.41880 type:complete len:91 (-) Transcript_43428:201-473(-)
MRDVKNYIMTMEKSSKEETQRIFQSLKKLEQGHLNRNESQDKSHDKSQDKSHHNQNQHSEKDLEPQKKEEPLRSQPSVRTQVQQQIVKVV